MNFFCKISFYCGSVKYFTKALVSRGQGNILIISANVKLIIIINASYEMELEYIVGSATVKLCKQTNDD